MGTNKALLRTAAASVLAAILAASLAPARADEGKMPVPAASLLAPIASPTVIEPANVEMTPEGKEVISKLRAGLLIDSGAVSISAPAKVDESQLGAQLRAGQLIDSGAVSVSELRPGNADQGQLETYAASALKDRLRAGQALDSDTLSISALRPGSVDQGQLQVYLAMADAPEAPQLSEVDQTLVFLAAMSVADGSEPVTMETASAILMQNAGVMPRSMIGVDGVWEFPRAPTQDEREMLVGEGAAWRIVENMESQLLFLGPDRRFGWDDFADIVNPLQHIPLINIAYRAMTGDEIHGAAQLVDLAMGPLAGVGTVFNLALEETTGASMEDYAMAALFGPPEYYDGSSVGIFAETPVFADPEEGEQVATLVRRGSER